MTNLIDTIVGTIFCFLNKYSTEFNPLSMENFRGKLSETVNGTEKLVYNELLYLTGN